MSITTVAFEEIALTVQGRQILADFDVSFTYTTRGHMSRCRVEEVAYYDREITIRDIDTDEEFEVHLPARSDDDLARQVEAAIWADEDRIRDAATDDLAGEFANAMELRRDAVSDDRLTESFRDAAE